MITINSLPNDKNLDVTKLKSLADDKSIGECNTILSAYTKYDSVALTHRN